MCSRFETVIFSIHTVGDGLFRRWAKLVERPDLINDARFQGDDARGQNRDLLCEIMADWCSRKTRAEALAALENAGVPAGPVLSLQEAIDNPQAKAMGFFKSVTMAGTDQPVSTSNLPLRFSSLEAGISTAPPALGADTEAVLRAAGFDPAAVQRLRDEKII